MKVTTVDHDTVVGRLRRVAKKTELHDAANAWLASLGTAPLRFRPVLAHLAYATNLPEHCFTPNLGAQSPMCAVCGATAEVTLDPAEVLGSIEKTGEAIVADLAEALVDLESFAALGPTAPKDEDVARFDAMLDVLARLPPDGRATDLVKGWSKIVPRSNAYTRASLVETLGVCGLLETLDHPGHLTRWVGFWEYEELPALNGEMRPPEAWWRRVDGVNRRALDLVFPHPGIDRRRFPARLTAHRPIAKGSMTLPKKKGKTAALELLDGDLIGVEYEGRWLCGVVLGVAREGKKELPVIELFAGSFSARPSPGALAKASARLVGPYLESPEWRREPVALDGLELFGPVMEATLERLERDHPPPPSASVPATHYRVIAPRNLLYFLATLLAGAPSR